MGPAPPTPLLSVAMIVRDAADLVKETLQSIRSAADEIVVLDTGSTDDTAAVAAHLGARVFAGAWNDDFSAARNACLKHVRGRWVLWLDAGEKLTAADAAALAHFVRTQADDARAYLMLVVTPGDGAAIDTEQAARVRLHPNRPELRFTGRVRETLEPALAAQGLSVDPLAVPIHRSGREHDRDHKTRRARRDLRLVELALGDDGHDPRLLVAQGEAFRLLGQWTAAAEAFTHAVHRAPRGSTAMLEAYYGLLSTLGVGGPKALETQVKLCLEALEVFPLDAQLLTALGGYLQQQQRSELAARSFAAAYEHGQVDPRAWHLAEIRAIAVVCYSQMLERLERRDEALALIRHALAEGTTAPRVRRRLIELWIASGDADEAVAELGRLDLPAAQRQELETVVRGATLAAQGQNLAAGAMLQPVYDAGCRDRLCCQWLAVALAGADQLAAAQQVAADWRQREPHRPEAGELVQWLAAAAPVTPRAPHVRRPFPADAFTSDAPLPAAPTPQ